MNSTTDNVRTYPDVDVVDGVSVTERDLNHVLEQRHLDGAVATVEQHDEVTTNWRQVDVTL